MPVSLHQSEALRRAAMMARAAIAGPDLRAASYPWIEVNPPHLDRAHFVVTLAGIKMRVSVQLEPDPTDGEGHRDV